jgi:hypothetical protein
MSRVVRLLGAAVLACASVPLVGVGAAHAAVVSETAAVGAYYWSANPGTVDLPAPVGAQKPFPDQGKGADGVAEDDLAVAVSAPGNAPDKWSALRWDLTDLTPGSVVSKAVIVVPLSTNPTSRPTPNAAPGFVVACAVGNEGFADADAEPFVDAPSVKCDQFSAKARPVDGAYEFDITALAQKWTDSNDGVALYPSAEGFAQPFTQVFAPRSEARLTIAFTPAAPEVVVPEVPTTPVDPGVVDGGTTTVPGGTFDPPVAPLPGLGTSGEAPAVASPQPQPGPVVQPRPRALQPVAAVATPLRFDAATWLAVAGGALLLALASLGLGAGVPAPARPTARAGGVGEQLARRQRASAPRPRAV